MVSRTTLSFEMHKQHTALFVHNIPQLNINFIVLQSYPETPLIVIEVYVFTYA
jgi:hypothetical protein